LVFGAGLGVLRENDRVLGTLQRVVLIVLSILAPPLAMGLTVFLVLLLFTGLDTLWDATKATTPILLCCAAGAVLLVNAVIRNRPEDESGSPLLRQSALVLAVTILPLAIIAAISMGLRIGQYGLTPERLWGLLVVAIGCAYGLAYAVSVALGRGHWPERLRPANICLAIGLCAVTLALALPIADFGAIAARDQLARLESGRTRPEQFDVRAMAYDFGPEGRALLQRIAQGRFDAKLAAKDRKALIAAAKQGFAAPARSAVPLPAETAAAAEAAERVRKSLKVLPKGRTVPAELETLIAANGICRGELCVLLLVGDDRAVLADRGCPGCMTQTVRYSRNDQGQWTPYGTNPISAEDEAYWRDLAAVDAARSAEPEVRTVTRRQIFLGGRPFSEPFE